MSELIRRQDAELILAREMYATSLEGGCDPVSPVDFLPEAKAWMSDAPTIGDWIPVTERLPESGRYLVDTCLYVFSPNILNYDSDTDRWFYDGCKGMDIETPFVAAWMPLPPAWKGEKNG